MSEKSERAQREEKILQFWKDNKIFEKTLEKDSPKGEYVFYDGPPFATGLPHYGSLLSSIIKDVIPRYKTMQGFRVRRRWGWDCHGLPIENMVEKELGIKNKKEIEEMGVAKFNKFCRDSVLRFVDEWKVFIDRVGRFVDYDNSYKTMDNSYIESVWWALKEIHSKGLLYEGRKVLLYCPHCETPLAKAEIAMDQSYKNVTEESVYVKFKIVGFPDAYFLAWTTTPWTLPGNVALAVGENIDYVEAKVGKEILVLAKERLPILTEAYEIIAEHKGKEMVGMEYEPLFEIPAVRSTKKKAFYISSADFVNMEEGTGIVHTAVIYGEDDYELGLKLDLPMVPLLDSAGHFNNESPKFIQGEYFKKAEKFVKEDLEKRNLLFKREMHTHSYPHCHRCNTALLYNALSSWFINIQKKKDKMISLNNDINWIPEHLKYGRFLNNIESAPDWTISRNRYWASPLPIWKDALGEVRVLGSIEELKKLTKKSGNKYLLMRHGEAENNVKRVVSVSRNGEHHLTEIGKKQVLASAEKLLSEKIDLIVSSPFTRARETAEIVSKSLKLNPEAIVFDERLREFGAGDFDGRSEDELRAYFEKHEMFNTAVPSGENFNDTRRRLGQTLEDLEKKYKGKNILIITHKICGWLLSALAKRLDSKESEKLSVYMKNGEFIYLETPTLPHNENFELDLHRPYIDEVELVSEDGKPLKRISEVIDGWVESGSMPFAEYHYPMDNKKEFEKNFPGDFIAEYIGQTRTWFYYMHTMAVLLFNNISFRNVITTGNILSEDGSKMSKSKGNFTDPMKNLNLFGADALRYYLVSSVVMRAEDTRFVDDEVRQIHNQVLNTLWNSFKFFEMYSDRKSSSNPHSSKNILDKWIIARLSELNKSITEGMDAYDTVRATRPIKDFISDFSTWYIRRSRDRFKGDDKNDRDFAIAVTKYVLFELSKLIAPVMPFIAEDIYQEVRDENDPQSVHLENWSRRNSFSLSSIFGSGSSNSALIKNMAETRRIVSLALEARSKANIKVRQPLQKLEARVKNLDIGFLELIKDEVNVKEVVDKNIDGAELNTHLTPELIEEGKVRDAIRAIQDIRKEKNLSPKDLMQFSPQTEDKELFRRNQKEIEKATNIRLEI